MIHSTNDSFVLRPFRGFPVQHVDSVMTGITKGSGVASSAREIARAWAGIAWIHAADVVKPGCLSAPSWFL
jgi:hypothetical protein